MVCGLQAQAQFVAYNDTTTPTGFFYANGGATDANPITTLVADDITFAPGFTGDSISQVTFSTVNNNTAALTLRPRLRFWATDGTGGLPGTFLAGFTFNPISFNASQALAITFTISPGTLVIPANGRLWAGITFDNVGATATTAQLNNIGQLLYNPPTVGSSSDLFFQTSAAGSFLQNNPPGGFFFFGGNPVANFFWQFQSATAATPEPGSIALLAGLGVFGASLTIFRLRRRR
jgi:hypothetical protein